MTEEINARQTTQEATSVVETGQGGDTGETSRNCGIQRKPMVSWASRTSGIDEAVKGFDFAHASTSAQRPELRRMDRPELAEGMPGFIHETYSRFHNYSLGNQLLALFQ